MDSSEHSDSARTIEAAIERKLDAMLASGEYSQHTRDSLHSSAKLLVEYEQFGDGKFDPDVLDLALFTKEKMERFLYQGERHLSFAFHPEEELQAVKDANPEQYELAINFILKFTNLVLTRRGVKEHHKHCTCTCGPVRLVWRPDGSQFIYTH